MQDQILFYDKNLFENSPVGNFTTSYIDKARFSKVQYLTIIYFTAMPLSKSFLLLNNLLTIVQLGIFKQNLFYFYDVAKLNVSSKLKLLLCIIFYNCNYSHFQPDVHFSFTCFFQLFLFISMVVMSYKPRDMSITEQVMLKHKYFLKAINANSYEMQEFHVCHWANDQEQKQNKFQVNRYAF